MSETKQIIPTLYSYARLLVEKQPRYYQLSNYELLQVLQFRTYVQVPSIPLRIKALSKVCSV